MTAFIADHREVFGGRADLPVYCRLPHLPSMRVPRLPAILTWPATGPSRMPTDLVKIKQVHKKSRGRYGGTQGLASASPRQARHRPLHSRALDANLRITWGVPAARRRRRSLTPPRPCPDDKVNRQFKAAFPNQLWVSDFTYVFDLAGHGLCCFYHRCLRPQNRRLASVHPL